MSVVINTNYAATTASNNLAVSNSNLQKSLNRLSSGSKIVTPSDDAGGLAVSMKLSAAAKRQGAVNTNIANAVSFLQTQDGALKVAAKALDRMSELRTMYSDVTKSDSDKANYETEFEALGKELTAIANEKFNSISLFGTGTSKDVAVTESVTTSDDNTKVTLTAKDLASDVGSTLTGFTATTDGSALDDVDLTDITDAIANVATLRANNGAEQSRLGYASELVVANKANLEAANSRIVDVDVAEESTQLARWNILVQSGTSMLSQANGSAQTALKLLS